MRGMVLAAALAAAMGEASAGELRGEARLAGPVPELPPLEATKDRAVCGGEVPDDSLVVSGGKLKNVVVVVKGGPRPPPAKVALDQERCRYLPHVQGAALGSTLEVVNGDALLHNVHGYVGQATAFNLAMAAKNQRIPRKLEKPGLVVVRCDVHSWMSAFVLVTDSPFAVSGADGAFRVEGLPPGRYTVTAWHERFGEKSASVTVPADGAAQVDFTFGR